MITICAHMGSLPACSLPQLCWEKFSKGDSFPNVPGPVRRSRVCGGGQQSRLCPLPCLRRPLLQHQPSLTISSPRPGPAPGRESADARLSWGEIQLAAPRSERGSSGVSPAPFGGYSAGWAWRRPRWEQGPGAADDSENGGKSLVGGSALIAGCSWGGLCKSALRTAGGQQ